MATFALIGGTDVRDYNNFVYTNTINSTTTRSFWSDFQTRQDVQTFVLPTSFDTETLSSITIATAAGGGSGIYQALLTGVDYANAPQVNPVGAPAPIAGAGLLSFFGAGGIALRKRARRIIA